MTILIAGTVDFPEDKREQALAESAQLVADTRSQQGCRHYVWSADPTSSVRVYVYECWDSTEDLAAHIAGRYYQEMLAVLGSFGAENASVAKFKVAIEEPVYDNEGKPRADFFTE